MSLLRALTVASLVTGCSMCDAEPDPDRVSTAPPSALPAPEPPPDPCPGADEALAAFAEASPIALDALPTGRGGGALDEDAVALVVADEVTLGETSLGTDRAAAVSALQGAEVPEGPIALYLRADEPLTDIAPLIRALPEGRDLELVLVETDHEHTECRFARQIEFGLRHGDEHGWVVFPSHRPVRDLVVALGGADVPRRVQLGD
ncbi:MAG: hypothetical protein CMN30_13205 [Sandaracinus sp.]|nr:hypothetical protein [Sandaracinus sp.]|tara:strand:- start:4945 stop:5559 length:615 start_codon:yes stop_codon:yes gene_type:complete